MSNAFATVTFPTDVIFITKVDWIFHVPRGEAKRVYHVSAPIRGPMDFLVVQGLHDMLGGRNIHSGDQGNERE